MAAALRKEGRGRFCVDCLLFGKFMRVLKQYLFGPDEDLHGTLRSGPGSEGGRTASSGETSPKPRKQTYYSGKLPALCKAAGYSSRAFTGRWVRFRAAK